MGNYNMVISLSTWLYDYLPLRKMIESGKTIYGYEINGRWLECGTKLSWLESNFYLSLKHPTFGERLKKIIKEI